MTITRSIARVLSIALLWGCSIPLSPLFAQGTEHHELLPSDGAADDLFGTSIVTDGLRVAVGAPRADQSGIDSGSAYLFSALSGSQLLELVPSDGTPGDQFGASVAIDGTRTAVGAPFANVAGAASGAVYVFDSASGNQLFKLTPSDAAPGDQFGCSIAMDGNLIVVGNLGAAYLFDASTGQELTKLLPMGGSTTFGLSGFGEAVAIDASLVVVGARSENGVSGFSGAAYVFDAGTGAQLHRLVATDGTAWSFFGDDVAIHGTTIAIGAPEASPLGFHSGTAYLFDAATGQQVTKFVPADGHVFANFGSSVAVDDRHIVIGADLDNAGGLFSSGSVYVYDAQSASFVTKLVASDAAPLDELGGAVAASSGVIVAGAIRNDDNGADSGSAYIFDGGSSVTTMTQCLVNAGNLTHVAGVAVAGNTMVFRMDSAQAFATSALLIASANPAPGWPNCGVDLGSAGELLVAPPALFATAPWLGSPIDFPVALPAVNGLAGVQFFLQGAFGAPASPSEPVRLTQGLQVVLGGYL